MVCGFPQPGTQLLSGALFSTRAFLFSVLVSSTPQASGRGRAHDHPCCERAFVTPSSTHPNESGPLSCLLLAATLTEGAFESEKVYFPGYILMIWKMGEQ